jgi:hypothetical protein
MSTSPRQNASVSPPSSPRRAVAHRGSPHHVPATPSRLRRSVAAASDRSSPEQQDEDKLTPLASPLLGSQNISDEPEPITNQINHQARGGLLEPSQQEVDSRTHLLEDYHKGSVCGRRDCNHGTFSPHVRPTSSNVSSITGFGGRHGDDLNDEDGEIRDRTRGLIGDTFADGLFGGSRRDTSMSTTKWLATKHGVKNQRAM